MNDDIDDNDEQRLASYERLLRDLLSSGLAVLPVLMCKHEQIIAADSLLPARYAAHQKLAFAYCLPPADTLATIRAAIAIGNGDPAQLYSIGHDRTHPDDSGYAYFFDAAREAWLRAISLRLPVPASKLPPPLYADLYPYRSRHLLVNMPLPVGWALGGIHDFRTQNTRTFSTTHALLYFESNRFIWR